MNKIARASIEKSGKAGLKIFHEEENDIDKLNG